MAGVIRYYAKQNGEGVRHAFTVSGNLPRKLSLFAIRASRNACIPAGELLDPPGRIYKLLLAREERVASRADADLQVATGGAGLVNGAARTRDRGAFVLRMNICFHGGKKGVRPYRSP